MSNAVLSHSAGPGTPAAPAMMLVVWGLLASWFTLVVWVAARGGFVTPPGTPPLPILAGFGLPLALFFTGYGVSRRFRELVLAADLRLMTGIQAWRFAGIGFLALNAHGILPGFFAWPAGLGDIAIGATAPLVVLALIRRPGFAASRTFLAWNVLGILDLVIAVGAGALGSGIAAGALGEPTTGAMAQLPLVLIPAYLVPLFIMLHAATMIQARRLLTSRAQG